MSNSPSQWWLATLIVAAAGYVFMTRNVFQVRESGGAERERLRRQLASLDVEIKRIMRAIARIQMQEEGAKDALARASEQMTAILSDLKRAADAYDELLSAADLDP